MDTHFDYVVQTLEHPEPQDVKFSHLHVDELKASSGNGVVCEGVTLSGGNVATATITATGRISSDQLTTTGNITSAGNVTVTQDVSCHHVDASGTVTCTKVDIDGASNEIVTQGSLTIKRDTETMAKFVGDGACELYHDNVKKMETTSDGVTLSGSLKIPDDSFLKIGNGDDLIAFHNGSNSFIRDNGTGILQVGTNGTHISIDDNANGKTIAQFKTGASDARAEFYYDNSKKLETTSTGATVTGSLLITAIPTSDPGVAGALYRDNNGHVKVSI